MFRYICVPEELYTEEIGYYAAYGILALEKQDGYWVSCGFLSDVSTDPTMVSDLTLQLNRQQVYPIHLQNVVEDWLLYVHRQI